MGRVQKKKYIGEGRRFRAAEIYRMDLLHSVRTHVVALLRGGQAYDTFDRIVADVPVQARGIVMPDDGRSIWQILEHIRRAQRDILDFSQNEDGAYTPRNWPEDYWPDAAAPGDGEWEDTIQAIRADRAEMERLALDPAKDLLAPFTWGEGQTLLREALLVADHTSYHLGQIVILLRLLGDDARSTAH